MNPLTEGLQYWLGNACLPRGMAEIWRKPRLWRDEAKPEMNNLKPILLQDKTTMLVIILHVNNMLHN